MSADSFPLEVLDGVESACCVFCAAFGGRYEVQHVARVASMLVLVDNDPEKLGALGAAHPSAITVVADAFDWVTKAAEVGMTFDLITFDPWTRDIDRVVAELLPLALKMAPVVVYETFDGDGPIRNAKTGLRWGVARR